MDDPPSVPCFVASHSIQIRTAEIVTSFLDFLVVFSQHPAGPGWRGSIASKAV